MTKATSLRQVPPGSETGVYYITVCNLPFGTNWQHLKDWLRTVCSVDHIELFPRSTSGWIRLKGGRNFERAWAFLKKTKFQGRLLVVSDRNRTQPIQIRELMVPAAAEPQGQWTEYNGERSTVGRSGGRRGGDLNPGAVPYTPQPGFEISLPYQYNGSPGDYNTTPYEYPQSTEGPVRYVVRYTAEHMAEYAPEPSVQYSVQCPAGGIGGSVGEQMPEDLPADARMIYLSKFPQQSKCRVVLHWIYSKLDALLTQITNVDVPQNENSHYLRGWASVVFHNKHSALAAMDLLKRAKFSKKRITVRLAIVGVDDAAATRPHGAPAPAVPVPYYSELQPEEPQPEEWEDVEEPSASEDSKVVIANGSSRKK